MEPEKIKPVGMDRATAMLVGRHVKAALAHLHAARDLMDDTDADLYDPYSPLAELFRRADEAMQDADTWAVVNARHNGGGNATYKTPIESCAYEGGAFTWDTGQDQRRSIDQAVRDGKVTMLPKKPLTY
jgi:hypothetical protein